MTEKIRKVLSFPSPVPAKADYQRVKSSYSVREIKQLFGLSERTVRRWTEAGIIHGTPVTDVPMSITCLVNAPPGFTEDEGTTVWDFTEKTGGTTLFHLH